MNIKLGDRITFHAVTRWSNRSVTRIVNGFAFERPTVRFGGYSHFHVRLGEISHVNGEEV